MECGLPGWAWLNLMQRDAGAVVGWSGSLSPLSSPPSRALERNATAHQRGYRAAMMRIGALVI